MISIMKTNGHVAYNVKEFAVDTPEELDLLPIEVAQGSVAIVISTSEVYMLNGSKEWVKI